MPISTPTQTEGLDTPSSVVVRQPDSPSTEASPATPAAGAGTLGREPRWGGRRRRLIAVAATVAVAVAAVAVFLALGGNGDDPAAETGTDTIRAVEATIGDLAETLTVDGTLAFEDPVTYGATVAGIVTRSVEADDSLDRGDTAYAVDESPVVVFWGDVPLYRPLSVGVDDGADVEVLEANLLALGYSAAGELTVDESFDAATTAAVEAFQADVGLGVDGIISPTSILVLDGPAVVNDIVTAVGSVVQTGSPVLSLQVTNEITAVTTPVDNGLLTAIPTIGDQFSTGDVAFSIATDPVVVIIGDVPLDRTLTTGVIDGEDIELLEQSLASLGYDAEGELIVDETFDEATAEALTAWEEDLGLTEDGVVSPGEFIVLPADHQVIDVEVEVGDSPGKGEIVFTVGVSTRTLTATVDVDDSDLIAMGDRVEVVVDGDTIAGTIADIDDPTPDPSDPSNEIVLFAIDLDQLLPDTAPSAVDVEITKELVAGATLVPASALLSMGDGTYAVEVVQGATTAFVAVEPGIFADGSVAVVGIEPGTAVVVPS